MIEKVDLTKHSHAARERKARSSTDTIVMHRFAADANKDGITTFEEAIAFFLRDPEGVATVALGGDYASKVETIKAWKRDGVPAVFQGRGFVPYHFLVDADGNVARMLQLGAVGAHAGNWNRRSVAVCCLGNADEKVPSEAQVKAALEVVRDVLDVYPASRVLSHDETLVNDDKPRKGCIGRFFPLDAFRAAARQVISRR